MADDWQNLRGLTVEDLVRFARSMGCEVQITLTPVSGEKPAGAAATAPRKKPAAYDAGQADYGAVSLDAAEPPVRERTPEAVDTETVLLTKWFKEHLPGLGEVDMRGGPSETSRLEGAQARLIEKAEERWVEKRQFSLSYEQVNEAFFAAARELGLLKEDDG